MDSQGPGNLNGACSLMTDRRATDNVNGVANRSRTGAVGSANSTPQVRGPSYGRVGGEWLLFKPSES